MQRTYSDKRPIVLEKDNGGYYLYRWDIQEDSTVNESNIPQYSYYEVIVWPTLTSDKITETCIREMWSPSVEAKKLNDYNAAVLGITTVEQKTRYVDDYKEFLHQRKLLKEQVEFDFSEWEKSQELLYSEGV